MAEPLFLLATDVRPGEPAWARVEAQAARLQAFAVKAFGVAPRTAVAAMPGQPSAVDDEFRVARVIERVGGNASMIFVLPTTFALNVWQRTLLGEELSEARRGGVAIHHDAVDLSHPLLTDCFCSQILAALGEQGLAPQQAGLLLVANGKSDPATRANAYWLMRTLWEQTGVSRADVGFVRHTQPFLPDALNRSLAEPLVWFLWPQCQWDGELTEYAQVMLSDHQRAHPESAAWRLLDPPRDHPAIQGWLEERVLRLWEEKQTRQAVHQRSAKYHEDSTPSGLWSGTEWLSAPDAPLVPREGCVARVREAESLAEILSRVLPPSERYLIKVTWHGYAQGTYTSPEALDRLLQALSGKAVILEGHTSSRNIGGLDIEWEREADQHRTWIRQQDREFIRKTGLADVIAKHQAQYLNVTEAWWDGACAPVEDVHTALGGVELTNPELAEFVPQALFELRGTPLISFARFKGPTRLGVSNLFGLIPHPLRTRWHGAAITDLAAACCDLARLYGSLFPLFGLVEAFDSAVRWNRKGLYRSRWGNYDLVLTDGLFTLSEGLVAADLLASRLQGQDVSRSAFFDVLRTRLDWPQSAIELPLPADLQTLLI